MGGGGRSDFAETHVLAMFVDVMAEENLVPRPGDVHTLWNKGAFALKPVSGGTGTKGLLPLSRYKGGKVDGGRRR